jgi:thioredoxin
MKIQAARLLTAAPIIAGLLTVGVWLGPGTPTSSARELAPVGEGVINVSDLTFHHRVLASKVPVLVDFWAPWCLPCRGLEATLTRVAADLGNKVRIVRVNISRNQLYARRYNVAALPATLVFMDGRLVDRGTGVLSADDIRGLLDSAGGVGQPSIAGAAGGGTKVAALAPLVP